MMKAVVIHILMAFLCMVELTLCKKISLSLKRGSIADKTRYKRGASSGPIGNLRGRSGEGYYVEMEIGTPPQKMNILIDTGSSNFAVAASADELITRYFDRTRSSTYIETDTKVNVPYTQGHWSGPLGTDNVTVPSQYDNTSVIAYIACITNSANFYINDSNWQGILGLAYAKIARPDNSVEPYFDTLVKENGLDDVFSVQLCGPADNGTNDMGGTLVLGGIEPSLYTGAMFYTPIYKQWYYEVTIVDIQVNRHSLDMDCKEYNYDKTIVDSGTTNLRLPVKVFEMFVKYMQQYTDMSKVPDTADFWKGDNHICWDEGEISMDDDFPVVTLTMAQSHDSTFKLNIPPQYYLRHVPEQDVGDNKCYKFAVSSSDSGTVIGAIVMEAFYTVFSRKNQSIGFAKSSCAAETGWQHSVTGPYQYRGNTTKCAYRKVTHDDGALIIVAYVMAGVCALCVLPLLIMVIQWWVKRSCPRCKRDYRDEGNLLEDAS